MKNQDSYSIYTIFRPLEWGSNSNPSIVLYFPGDIQASESEMRDGSYKKQFLSYSIEKTAEYFEKKFPSSIVACVCPSSHNGNIACYRRFCLINKACEAVEYDSNGKAVIQLMKIIRCLIDYHLLEVNFDNVRIHLFGFSRGCIVLNQIVAESRRFPHSVAIEEMKFWNSLFSLTWIDSGNGGKKGAYPVDKYSAECLVQLPLINQRNGSIRILGTSYQWKDRSRPWIFQEALQFAKTLTTAGLQTEPQCLDTKKYQHNGIHQHFQAIFNSVN